MYCVLRLSPLGEAGVMKPAFPGRVLWVLQLVDAGPSRLRVTFEMTPWPCVGTAQAGRPECQCGTLPSLVTHTYIMPVVIILTTDTSSASEDEGSLRRPGRLTSTPLQSHSSVEPWLDRVIQGSSTSSSASSTSSHPGGRPAAALAGLVAHTHIG